MIRGSYDHRHYVEGEIVEDRGRKYIFHKIIPNHPIGCDLYSEGKERLYGFCGNCGGCSTSQPKGCVRGIFKLIKEE